MRRYLKYSLTLHAAILGLLLVMTYVWSGNDQRSMKFVILPKGTSLDAVLTPELAREALQQPSAEESEPTQTPEVPATPTATPTSAPATPSPLPESTATPAPSPSPTAAATPTPAPTPTPEKTIITTPKPSPTPRAPSPTPKPKLSPRPSITPARSARSSPTAAPKRTPAKASATKSKTGSPAGNANNLPRRLPAGVTPRAAAPHEEVGVPGVPEGVEGAPLPLDRNQSMLSALYATRARMKIQSNFTVPPDVNDPNLTCVVEWEILPDGTIRNVRVVKSSGVARLDACAVDALRKTENLGPLPPEWGNRSVWTSLTFVFAGDLPSAPAPDSAPASANPRATEH